MDFKDTIGTDIKLELRPITKENAQQYITVFEEKKWKALDFKNYSRYHNPTLKHYKFNADYIIEDLEKLSP